MTKPGRGARDVAREAAAYSGLAFRAIDRHGHVSDRLSERAAAEVIPARASGSNTERTPWNPVSRRAKREPA